MNLQAYQQTAAHELRRAIESAAVGGDISTIPHLTQQLVWALGGNTINTMPPELVPLYVVTLMGCQQL